MALQTNLVRKTVSWKGHIVVPALDVSGESLLAALLAIIYQIFCCEKPKRLLRKNTLLLSHKLKVLSLLFQELSDSTTPLTPSTILCLRELYVVLQKARDLFEECTNEESYIWLLMKTQVMSSKFEVVTSDLAFALKMLPLALLDLSDEVKEHVSLITDQAARGKSCENAFEVELRQMVLTVLGDFEKEIQPDESLLRKIIAKLQLGSARDCQKEIQLLKEKMQEIQLLKEKMRYHIQANANQNVLTMDSLIGFMLYCKCMLFDDVNIEPQAEKENEGNEMEGAISCVPDDFLCPISLDLMRYPVTISSGQTYDLDSIGKWFKEGHSTCPKTGQRLLSNLVIPNLALRNLIIKYCSEHNISFERKNCKKHSSIERIESTKATIGAIKMIAANYVEKLASRSSTMEEKSWAAYQLRMLAKCSTDSRAYIAEAGAIPLLVGLLSCEDAKLQENAVTALLNLSIHQQNRSKLTKCEELVQAIIYVLKSGLSMEARQNAAATLFSLSSTHEGHKKMADAIPALVDLLRNGTIRGKRDAANALFNLSIHNANAVVAAGAVPLLVDQLANVRESGIDNSYLDSDVVAVLAMLASHPVGLSAISKASGVAVEYLVNLLASSSSLPKCKENCVVILLTLCLTWSEQFVSYLLTFSSLMPALYNLLTTGTPKARKKTTSLLKVLHSWDKVGVTPQV